MIYCKIPRPAETTFSKNKQEITFSLMYVSPLNDPQEKYCYVEIPESLFEDFLKGFGTEGVEVIDREEFPDNFFDMAKGRFRKFTVIQSRDQLPISSIKSSISFSTH